MTATASHIQPAVERPGTPERPWIRRHPLLAFFAAAYGASLVALAVIGLPRLHPSGGTPLAPLVMFPLMVLTVGVAGVALTAVISGRAAARQLLRGTRRWRVRPAYYLALLIPPACILVSLVLLHALVGSAFTPNMFPIGLAFGAVAGFFEEFGWSGFAYPRMGARFGLLRGALLLGLIWGVWHVPVVDSLGAASPHGSALPLFFLAFVLAQTSLRVLIAWIYTRTGSLLMAQCMHASSTGFLVVLGAAHVTSTQEALWYAVYGALLGAAAASVWLLLRPAGRDPLRRCPAGTPSTQTLTETDTETTRTHTHTPPTRQKEAIQMSTTNESASAVTDRDHVAGVQLPTITDEFMRQRIASAKPYTLMLLKKTPKYRQPDADPIVWEHGRRNMALEQHGALAIVLPVGGDELAGIGIFNATPEEVSEILNGDPGIQAGIFTCELHAARGFPSSALP